MVSQTAVLSHKAYFQRIIEKYDYIDSIWVTDVEGALVLREGSEIDPKLIDKVKGSLSFLFNSAYDQLIKTDRDKIRTIVVGYDKQTLLQSKIANNVFVNIFCDSQKCNIEMTKLIIKEISQNIITNNIEG